MRKKRLLLFIFLAAGLMLQAGQQCITIGTLTDYPPYCFDRKDAQPVNDEIVEPGFDSQRLQGYSWDVVRESFHAAGVSIRLVVAPWKRCLYYLENMNIELLFPASRTPQREKKFVYAEKPVNNVQYVIYVPRQVEFEWQSLESLNGKRIVAMRDWNYGDRWSSNTKIVKEHVDSISQCFKVLDKNRVFGVAGYDIPFGYVLKTEGKTKLYRELPSFDSDPEYLIGNRSHKKIGELLDLFLKGLTLIKENGELTRIEKKWM